MSSWDDLSFGRNHKSKKSTVFGPLALLTYGLCAVGIAALVVGAIALSDTLNSPSDKQFNNLQKEVNALINTTNALIVENQVLVEANYELTLQVNNLTNVVNTLSNASYPCIECEEDLLKVYNSILVYANQQVLGTQCVGSSCTTGKRGVQSTSTIEGSQHIRDSLFVEGLVNSIAGTTTMQDIVLGNEIVALDNGVPFFLVEYVLNLTSGSSSWQGVFTNGTTYKNGDFVISGPHIYQSIIEGNTEPTSNSSAWVNTGNFDFNIAYVTQDTVVGNYTTFVDVSSTIPFSPSIPLEQTGRIINTDRTMRHTLYDRIYIKDIGYFDIVAINGSTLELRTLFSPETISGGQSILTGTAIYVSTSSTPNWGGSVSVATELLLASSLPQQLSFYYFLEEAFAGNYYSRGFDAVYPGVSCTNGTGALIACPLGDGQEYSSVMPFVGKFTFPMSTVTLAYTLAVDFCRGNSTDPAVMYTFFRGSTLPDNEADFYVMYTKLTLDGEKSTAISRSVTATRTFDFSLSEENNTDSFVELELNVIITDFQANQLTNECGICFGQPVDLPCVRIIFGGASFYVES